jgi:hypothetical protein
MDIFNLGANVRSAPEQDLDFAVSRRMGTSHDDYDEGKSAPISGASWNYDCGAVAAYAA